MRARHWQTHFGKSLMPLAGCVSIRTIRIVQLSIRRDHRCEP